MSQPNLITDDYTSITEKVRSGEFFRESRNMYDFVVHDPMSERYIYVFITTLAMAILLITIVAMQSLYPLRTSIPFIVNSEDIVEETPNIKSLLSYPGESIDIAIIRFVVNTYVGFREQYDIATFERNTNGIKAGSTPEVFAEYQRYIDPRNPESPITLYQRHSIRKITIIQTKLARGQDDTMEVLYETLVQGKGEQKRTRWQATVAFNYNPITLDEETGKVNPFSFTVTQYRTKRLQDVK